MKFISLKENLKQGLSIVGHLTSKNINLPILNNILIKAKKEGLELISTNLEISISHFLRSKVESEGELLVDSRVINEYVSLLPDDKVEIEGVNEELKIKCKNYKTKINTQSGKDFPIIPKIEGDSCFFVKTVDFKKAINSVLFSVSNNENRAEISGVFFSFSGGKLVMVATDSYRLAEKTISFKGDSMTATKNVIVPAKTLQEVVRVLSNFKEEDQLEDLGEIKMCLTESQVLFVIGSSSIVSRLIVGSYPDYKQIIPEKENTRVMVEKGALVKALKTAGIFSKTGINDVGVSIKKNKLIIFSSSSQVGENFIEIDVETRGEEVEIFVNYKYLLEGLNNILEQKVVLAFVDNASPCKIYSEEEKSFLYIVMPIRQ
ncbi:DNA polymerase III subunit beta [Candidatus Falkowbacteria bacterium HGW-Falkowbacteria-1]|jgi:DNA polymerase-3 subunit beta|uniref:Beta sliding clamp n=1 Tax=Candidatus Falkowbacteria bacterium HGW-Falkowbacteria-1 TaxID=2013768 RepID=A0A2N2E918_9BACT|nr:MAG: DNA polymerase III subunit beta [Candidatus Falkowbacteria bacterium HGW-Falkowbacteria-1]